MEKEKQKDFPVSFGKPQLQKMKANHLYIHEPLPFSTEERQLLWGTTLVLLATIPEDIKNIIFEVPTTQLRAYLEKLDRSIRESDDTAIKLSLATVNAAIAAFASRSFIAKCYAVRNLSLEVEDGGICLPIMWILPEMKN